MALGEHSLLLVLLCMPICRSSVCVPLSHASYFLQDVSIAADVRIRPDIDEYESGEHGAINAQLFSCCSGSGDSRDSYFTMQFYECPDGGELYYTLQSWYSPCHPSNLTCFPYLIKRSGSSRAKTLDMDVGPSSELDKRMFRYQMTGDTVLGRLLHRKSNKYLYSDPSSPANIKYSGSEPSLWGFLPVFDFYGTQLAPFEASYYFCGRRKRMAERGVVTSRAGFKIGLTSTGRLNVTTQTFSTRFTSSTAVLFEYLFYHMHSPPITSPCSISVYCRRTLSLFEAVVIRLENTTLYVDGEVTNQRTGVISKTERVALDGFSSQIEYADITLRSFDERIPDSEDPEQGKTESKPPTRHRGSTRGQGNNHRRNAQGNTENTYESQGLPGSSGRRNNPQNLRRNSHNRISMAGIHPRLQRHADQRFYRVHRTGHQAKLESVISPGNYLAILETASDLKLVLMELRSGVPGLTFDFNVPRDSRIHRTRPIVLPRPQMSWN